MADGDHAELLEIESSNVRLAGYNSITRVMTVVFENGSRYEYFQVPPDLWSDFLKAQPNPWSEVGYPRLVQGGFQYRKVS